MLGWGLAAGVVAGADLSVPGALETLRRTGVAKDTTVWANLIRPADQLWLRWELLNFRLLRTGEAGPGDPATARLVIAERAFYQVDPNFPGTGGDEAALLTTPVPATIAGKSRLAFRVPWDTDPIPFTVDALLAWGGTYEPRRRGGG